MRWNDRDFIEKFLSDEEGDDKICMEFNAITTTYSEIGGFSIFKKYTEIDSAHFAYLINGIMFFAIFLCPLFSIVIDGAYNINLVFTNGINQTEYEGIFYDLHTTFWVMVFYAIFFSLLNRILAPVYTYAIAFLTDILCTIIYITIVYPLALLYECVYGLLYKISGWEGFYTDYEQIDTLKRDMKWITEWIANRKIKKQIKKQEQERKKQEQAKKREQARRDSILANLTPKQKEGWNTLQTLRRCYMNGFEKYVRFWDLVEEEERDGRTFKTHYDFFKYMEDRFVKKYNLPEECRMKNAKNCKYANYKVRYDD